MLLKRIGRPCLIVTQVILVMAVASLALGANAASAADAACALRYGANVNESLACLDPVLLDRSQTAWVRGFLPASQFISGKRSITNDAGGD